MTQYYHARRRNPLGKRHEDRERAAGYIPIEVTELAYDQITIVATRSGISRSQVVSAIVDELAVAP